ncbi:MAG: hypothetical protein BAJALOKI1v1_150030 [Promethearchaeota archaeon]|nr:MAG: hypothetical protein BAJALOKI1v1_150030 [Candidatus Lokiarchaeota archaeon]
MFSATKYGIKQTLRSFYSFNLLVEAMFSATLENNPNCDTPTLKFQSSC